MKQLIGILLAVILMPASSSFAFVGGPFGNDSYFQNNTDGVYEAVATMSNGVGMYRFVVRNNSLSSGDTTGTGILQQLSGRGNVQFGNGNPDLFTHTWFYKGIVYGGQCFGISNSSGGIVTATGNAQSNAGALQTSFTTINTTPPTVIATTTGTNFTAGPSAGNVVYANSAWVADIDEEYPTLRFSGKGQVNFVGELDIVTETRSVTVTGTQATDVEVDIDTTSSSGSTVTSIDNDGDETITASDSTAVNSTGGDDPAFAEKGHERNFLVFGSRVSLTIFP